MNNYYKNINFINILFLLINFFVVLPKSYSMINSFNVMNRHLFFSELPNEKLNNKNTFTENPTLFKSYGPLSIDMNNIKYKDSVFFLPTINDQSKPLFLAVYCSKSLINVKGSLGWKGWQKSYLTFENNLVYRLCESIDKY